MSLHSTTFNCLPAKDHLRRTVVSDEVFKADFRGIEGTHVVLSCRRSLNSDGGGVAVSVSIQSLTRDCNGTTKNLLDLEDIKDLLDADLGVAVELSEERKLFVEEGHAEQTLLADELLVRHDV